MADFPDKEWERLIAINLSATFHLTRATFAGMKAQKWGRIVNIASAHALVASPFKSAYVAAKHGILGFTKTIALEGAEFGVTCNAICPGYVYTPLVEAQSDEMNAGIIAATPMGRMGTPREVANVCLFLASDDSSFVTGSELIVDGGYLAQ